jgi:hypothetical protein
MGREHGWWAVDDGRRTIQGHTEVQNRRNPSPNQLMVCTDRRTRAKSSTPSTPESLRARSRREPPPPPAPPLSVSPADSWCSTATLLRTAAALIDACVVRIGAVPIPLKRVLLSGTIQSIDMSPTVLVLAAVARRLLALRCRPNTPESGRISATSLVVGSGSGSGCVEGHLKGSRGGDGGEYRGVDVYMDQRETLGGRGDSAGGKEVRRNGLILERSRLRLDREPSFSREPERGTDGSPVNRGRGALCGSGTE